MINNSDTVFCTVATGNYLARARTLARSVHEHHPDAPFVLLLCDRQQEQLHAADEPFSEILIAEDLGIQDFRDMAFRYDALELCAAMKPYLLLHLLGRWKNVIFLDADTLLLSPMEEIMHRLEANPVLLTPHALTPPDDDREFNDHMFLRSGAFNIGFIAVRENDEAVRMLSWWKEKVTASCYLRPEQGLFAEQKWLDLAPVYFDCVRALRDEAYNVGFWNLHERSVSRRNGQWMVNGKPIVFFHFSGFDPLRPLHLTRYAVHLSRDENRDLSALYDEYRALLMKEGYAGTSSIPYAYGSFADGTPVTADMRRMYAKRPRSARTGDPFDTTAQSGFFRWMRTWQGHAGIPGMVNSWLDRRHAWQPYQHLARRMRALMGPERFGRIRDTVRFADRMTQRKAIHRIITIKQQGRPAGLFGVNLVCHASSESGLGEGGRSTIRSLQHSSIPFRVLNQEHPGIRTQDRTHDGLYSTDHPHAVSLLQINPEQLWQHIRMHGTGWLENKYVIGYWSWELTELPDAWKDTIGLFDELWTISDYMHTAITPHTDKPVLTMPLNLAVADERTHGRASFGIPEGSFVYLYAFDFHSTMERKNPLGFVEAFRRAFPANDRPMIVMKTTNGHMYPEKKRMLEQALEGLPSVLLDGYMSHAEVHDLIGVCDVYVSLHRSEGYGLTIAEAMWMGKPVITTDYGGSRDFLHASHGYPVPYTMTTVAHDSPPYRRGSTWAEPDTDAAARILRHLYEHPDEARLTGARARLWAREHLSPEATAAKISGRISEIYLKLGLN